jgi:hypothetical protein
MDVNIGAALWLAARGTGELLVRHRRAKPATNAEPQSLQHQSRHAPSSASSPLEDLVSAPKVEQSPPERKRSVPATEDVHSEDQATKRCPSDGTTSAPGAECSPKLYTSQARVVLLGHGADEVFGGYGRHRTAFRNDGLPGLQAELALDMSRLWSRNLGRDDRIVADSSREARHPFLDEALLETVAHVPLELVADLSQPPGQGDKALLRAVARHLGLSRAACRVKRAIQFGSRIGNKSNVLVFGSNRAANRQGAGRVRVAK